jgi:CMP-2-keto-3-deoxyoctulosonic acid synthetase
MLAKRAQALAGVARDPKLRALRDKLREIGRLEPGSKVLVFAESRETLEYLVTELTREGLAPLWYHGDLPTIEPYAIQASLLPLADPAVDIATLAVEITREEERRDPNVVKIVATPLSAGRMRALYFSRATVPYNDGPHYHHIGLYAYRRKALQRFVQLPPSTLEKREKLEQLRALEAGMRIDVSLVDAVPLGVDTPHDLERARALLAPKE